MSSSTDLQQIESRIGALVREYAGLARQADIPPELDDTLERTIDQAVVSSEGGKRLRALLALGAYDLLMPDAGEARRSAMLDIACAIEVFQTAALVHDDIIDDADLRRGKPSAHRALAQATHSEAIGRGLGVMLGDLLATACTAIMDDASQRLDIPQSRDLRRAFITMHHEVEIGQMLDLAIERMPLSDPDKLGKASYEVFRWKTASYTTIAPLELAFLASGMGSDDAMRHAMAIGWPLGVAFQLADDLIDVIGSSKQTGKPVGGDIREGKRTVLLSDALRAASPKEARELTRIYAKRRRGRADVERVTALMRSTGAVERSYARIGEMWTRTTDAIGAMGLDDGRSARLTAICARFIPQSARA